MPSNNSKTGKQYGTIYISGPSYVQIESLRKDKTDSYGLRFHTRMVQGDIFTRLFFSCSWSNDGLLIPNHKVTVMQICGYTIDCFACDVVFNTKVIRNPVNEQILFILMLSPWW